MKQLRSVLQPVASSLSQLSHLQESLRKLVMSYNSTYSRSLSVNHDQESKIDKLDPVNVALRARHGDLTTPQNLDRRLNNFQLRNARLRKDMSICHCKTHTTSVTLFRWPAALSHSVSKIHLDDCVYSTTEDAITEIDLRMSLCSAVLRRKFTMAVGFSFSLAGGFGIRVGLSPIAIVDSDSQAFAVVRDFWRDYDQLAIPGSWKGSAAKLHALFEAREASPHDRLSSGKTLIHVCCSLIIGVQYRSDTFKQDICSYQSSLATNPAYGQDKNRVDNFVGLAGYLLRCMGMTAQEKDDTGR